ncbi:DNA-binding protein [Metapseudomonas furukawaii]|mgnify:CR=1 FL=1|uniref:DNA-binding protein n=1 Tax=Metapseudomonas furukawaii TaxID=1149133 RepID=UPI0009DA2BC3|nr:DNA-binding protein [Pseudomonas furukawaii]
MVPKGPSITRLDVARAVNFLIGAGEQVTIRAVRNTIGAGSFTTISKYLHESAVHLDGVGTHETDEVAERKLPKKELAPLLKSSARVDCRTTSVLDGLAGELREIFFQCDEVIRKAEIEIITAREKLQRSISNADRLTHEKHALIHEVRKLRAELAALKGHIQFKNQQ